MLNFLQFDFLLYKPSCVMDKTKTRKFAYRFHFDVSRFEVLHQSNPVLDDLIPSNNKYSLVKNIISVC